MCAVAPFIRDDRVDGDDTTSYYRMHAYLLRLELEPRELALELLDVIFRTHRVTQWR